MKSIWKFFIGFTSLLIIGALVFAFYFYNNAENMAEEVLRERFIKDYNEKSNTNYIIDFEKLKVDVIDGSIQLINLSIVPKDSLVTFKSNLEQRNISNSFLEIHIDKISLSKFDYAAAAANRKVSIEKLQISNPNIHVYHYPDIPNPESKSQDTVDIRSIFLNNFDSLNLRLVDVNNAKIKYLNVSRINDTTEILSISNLNYEITEVSVNRNSLEDAPFIESKRNYLSSKNIEVFIHNKAEIKIGTLDFDGLKKEIVLGKIKFNPETSPTKYFNKLKYRKPWIKFGATQIIISDIDINKWIDSNQISIHKLKLVEPKADIRLNLLIPVDTNFNKPMFGEMLKQIPVPFSVDTVLVENGLIELDFLGKATKTHGKLFFNKMNINATNVTNNEVLLAQNPIIPIDANLSVNKTGNVTAQLKIDMLAPKSTTIFNVQANDLDLRKFSSILKPIVRVEITSGKMVSLNITSVLNKDGGTGFMDAHYTNLNLLIMEKDLSKKSGFFLRAASSVANGIVLKNDNIPGFPHYRTGTIFFEKEYEDAFFKMLWLTTLHGLEDSILGSEKKDHKQEKKGDKVDKKDARKIFNLK